MESLWYAHFSTAQTQGDGIAVLRDGQILGGDPSHIYVGTYQFDGSRVYASVRVKPYARDGMSQAREEAFDLFLRGALTGDSATVSGHPDNRADMNIAVELHRAA